MTATRVVELGGTVGAEAVLGALSGVIDPELGVDVVNLGMVYGVDCIGAAVHVEMTLTTPGCPLHGSIVEEVKRAVRALNPDLEVAVELVWDPPWTPEAMSDEAKRALHFM